MDATDVAFASASAATALEGWNAITPEARGKILRKWADSKFITLENGKPFSEENAEVTSTASYLKFYSGGAERAYGDAIHTANPADQCFAIKQPIGVVTCMTLWNFPAAMIARKAGGAIAAGYTVVVKSDGGTPLTALAMAYLAEQSGLPKRSS